MIRRKVYISSFNSSEYRPGGVAYKQLVRAYDEFSCCGYDFWITRSLSSEGSRPKYRCTEKTTGAGAGPIRDTIAEAKSAAISSLTKIGPAGIKKAIEHWLSEYGSVDSLPEYKEEPK